MTDKPAIVRAIIERALSDLVAVGMTPEGAAEMLAIQGVIRLECMEQLEHIARLVRESTEAFSAPESLH